MKKQFISMLLVCPLSLFAQFKIVMKDSTVKEGYITLQAEKILYVTSKIGDVKTNYTINSDNIAYKIPIGRDTIYKKSFFSDEISNLNSQTTINKDDLLKRAGINLQVAGGCFIGGVVLYSIAPLLTIKSIDNRTKIETLNTIPTTISYVLAGGLNLTAFICLISSGHNLVNAGNLKKNSLKYKISTNQVGICYNF